MAVEQGPHHELRTLGPVQLLLSGTPVHLGTPKQRAVVAALALSGDRVVSFDTLADRIWGRTRPATAVPTMQRYVAALRKLAGPGVIVTEGAGYRLGVPAAARDDHRLAREVAAAEEWTASILDPWRPAVSTDGGDQVRRAFDLLSGAVRRWHGEPYAELDDNCDAATAERTRLRTLLERAHDLRLTAALALGRHDVVTDELRVMTLEHPLQERWWALRALALVRGGRQGEALACLAELRGLLSEELGIDPSPRVEELHTAILRQDPTLGVVAADVAASPPDSSARPHPTAVRHGRDLVSPDVWLSRFRRGGARAMVISGGRRSGRSSAAEAIASQAAEHGVRALVGRCRPGQPALWPLHLLAASVAEEFGRTSPNDLDMDSVAGLRAVIELIAMAVDQGPAVLIIDDLQWADPATCRAVEHCVLDLSAPNLGLVVTHAHDEPVTSTHAEQVLSTLRRHGAAHLGVDQLRASVDHREDTALHAVPDQNARSRRSPSNHNPTRVNPQSRINAVASSA